MLCILLGPTEELLRMWQSAADPSVVDCDAALAAVLGEPRVKLSSLEQRLAPLLAPAPPHMLQYTVRCAAQVP